MRVQIDGQKIFIFYFSAVRRSREPYVYDGIQLYLKINLNRVWKNELNDYIVVLISIFYRIKNIILIHQ